LSWPSWVINTSPFAHIPKLPGAAVNAAPLIVLTALAIILIAIGVARFRRRDLASP
jgi:ABC-2 type transport system permease protein